MPIRNPFTSHNLENCFFALGTVRFAEFQERLRSNVSETGSKATSKMKQFSLDGHFGCHPNRRFARVQNSMACGMKGRGAGGHAVEKATGWYSHAEEDTDVDEFRRLRLELLSTLVDRRPMGRLILRFWRSLNDGN